MASSTPINVVICGYYGQANAGDEALLMTLLQMLPEGINAIVLSAQPDATAKSYGVQTIHRYDLVKIVKAFRASHWFIWGGGSLMQDSSSWRNPIYYGGVMMLAQFLGLKTLAWAQGIGPLNRSISKALSRKTFGGCDRVSVRDEGSQELLTSWGISSLRAPDPVWNLKADDTVKSDLDPATIAVNLRPHSSLPEIRLDLLIEALKLLQAQINCPILLLPFHRGEDDLLADAIAEILNLGAKVQILKIDDPRQLKAVFAQVRFLIGMRLHSLIMAASMGCSSFALSYDPKVTQLMAHANLPGWELDQLPPTPQEIAHQWERSYRQNHHLDREALTSIQQQVNCHQELLSQLIVPSKQPLGEGRN